MGEDQETNTRNKRKLRRSTIVENRWCRKVKKEVKKSKVLQNEIISRGTTQRKKEELRKVRRQ
jgi:hypothetical protein